LNLAPDKSAKVKNAASSSLTVLLSGWAGAAAVAVTGALAAESVIAPGTDALSQAIEEAEPYDVIILSPGTYAGPVVLSKPLSLVGRDGARIDGGGEGSVITVAAPDVLIENLEIENSGRNGVDLDSGVKLTERAIRARVLKNTLRENLVGADIHGAADAVVADNEIYGLTLHRMNDRGNGVYVWNAPGAKIERNHIVGGRDGVFINTSRNNVISGNRMENLRFAVHYMYTLESRISENVSVGNHLGFALMFSSELEVRNNQSIDDRDHGVMLNFVNDSRIEGNEVRGGAEKCFFLYNANDNEITGNRFKGCEIGVHFTAGSANDEIWNNAFIDNRMQVKYVNTTDLDWSRDGVGNYWSDYAAYDINGDGIGDQPFRPNSAMDQVLWTQPAARYLLGSPAVQIVNWTQRAFPALLPGGVIDSAPLMRPPAMANQRGGGG